MDKVITFLHNKRVLELSDELEQRFKSVPHLPSGLTEFLVRVAPYLALLSGVLSIISGLAVLTGNNLTSMMGVDVGISQTYFQILGLQSILLGVLYILSFKYLKERSFTGWLFMLWGTLINTAFSALGFAFGATDIIGFLIGLLISLYILYEVKPHYSSVKTEK